ncbi:prephenate dehydratase [Alkaliphilus peptidifermentans]|uniref:Prephenate dehydratase n=1 Tax=Alkaliphilus peptidifermentans DSM 18978 TaxID=1120976 RepID=A0A1G5DAS6_9FIRM|nr:prephenate dehydratase [Alkaliphilus peptidifermentans]SCY11637.1 prephenate dehydratase [Alkaliphilus peptidifermentans DSM 18978]
MEIGYLGPAGSFSHMAAYLYSQNSRLVPLKTFTDIIQGVEEKEIDEGILPIENSTEGAVTQVMDSLMKTRISTIRGEVILKIEHCILSDASSVEEIRHIYSHHQAIQQCRDFFNINYPHISLHSCDSSSSACMVVKEMGNQYGAIANTYAAKIHKLKILKCGIQDNNFNQTRFIIIGGRKTIVTGNDKTSIVFSFHNDYPGSLYLVLKAFADRGINLTRIESRPAKTEMGKYVFYIDFIGHKDNEMVMKVFEDISIYVNYFKVLGSYPIGITYE